MLNILLTVKVRVWIMWIVQNSRKHNWTVPLLNTDRLTSVFGHDQLSHNANMWQRHRRVRSKTFHCYGVIHADIHQNCELRHRRLWNKIQGIPLLKLNNLQWGGGEGLSNRFIPSNPPRATFRRTFSLRSKDLISLVCNVMRKLNTKKPWHTEKNLLMYLITYIILLMPWVDHRVNLAWHNLFWLAAALQSFRKKKVFPCIF